MTVGALASVLWLAARWAVPDRHRLQGEPSGSIPSAFAYLVENTGGPWQQRGKANRVSKKTHDYMLLQRRIDRIVGR